MRADFFKFIIKNIFKRKLRLFLTVFAITIGIASVITLILITSGIKSGIEQEFASLGSDKIIITAATAGFGPPGTAVSMPLTIKDKEKIQKINGANLVVGRLIRLTNIEYEEEVKNVPIASIPEDQTELDLVLEAMDYHLEKGRLPKKDSFEITIGKNIAISSFDKGVGLRDKILVENQELEVSGIFESTGNPQKDDAIIIPEETLRSILQIDQDYDAIIVQTTEELNKLIPKIEDELRDIRAVKKGSEDFSVESPQNLLNTLNSIIIVLQGVLVGIASIALFVGSVGIMNTMYTNVVERTNEIGILRSIGAKRSDIKNLFLTESAILGFIGGVFGIIIGSSIALLIEYVLITQLSINLVQINISPILLITLTLLSTIIGALSGYFPSNEASMITPVEAMRK